MELRSRSRSSTPYQTQSFVEAESFEGNNHLIVTRSSRRTTSHRTTIGGDTSLTEEFYTSTAKPSVKSKSTKSRNVASTFKTSDYSSEEGEIESTAHISENEKNQIIEDAKAAANGKSEISALNLYRRAGRYWDKYPKTDYTYSRHSRDRVELAPGVVQMPNMSRRTIHLYDSSTNTDSYFDRIASKSQYLRQRLFSSQNNNTEAIRDNSYKINRVSSSLRRRTITSTITSVFTSVYTVIFWCFYSVHLMVNSSTLWFMKKLHHVASRVMLLDNWLLGKAGGDRRTKAVVALCLLPLLLFGAWWLLWSLGSFAYGALLNPSNGPVMAPPPIEQKVLPSEAIYAPSKLDEKSNWGALSTDEIVEKILQSPQIHNVINYYQQNAKSKQSGTETDEKLLKVIGELQEEINNIKEELIFLQQTKNADLNKILARFQWENRKIGFLSQKLNRCCDKPVINLEPYVAGALRNLLNDPEFLTDQNGFTDWLHALFVAKQDLEIRLSALTQNLTQDYDRSVENTAKLVMEKVVARFADGHFNSESITEEQIKKVVRSALMVYDADKTGLVDYAMEPMGGQIVTTRCTESYHTGTAVISVLGIPLWYPSNSPRIVIVPGINPGECWAFQNFPGFVVVKLANRIRVEAFSVEHVSRLLVPKGKIDSAPKEFEVYGLNDENDRDPVKIGEYVYDYDGDPIQYFAAQQHGLVFGMVEVRIKSNHGNPNYTCLYRFRVHGSLSSEPT